MKKYQLKWNYNNKLEIVKESNILYDILVFVNNALPKYISGLSIWMDGKVLE